MVVALICATTLSNSVLCCSYWVAKPWANVSTVELWDCVDISLPIELEWSLPKWWQATKDYSIYEVCTTVQCGAVRMRIPGIGTQHNTV